MGQEDKYGEIVDKLNRGMKFGIFERSMKCYFQDGSEVNYNDLWKAIRIQKNLESTGNKTLGQLCPDNYVGSFNYKHSQHKWNKSK